MDESPIVAAEESRRVAEEKGRGFALTLLAYCLIAGGFYSLVATGILLARRHVNLDLGILQIPAGFGLLALRPGWRKIVLGYFGACLLLLPVVGALSSRLTGTVPFDLWGLPARFQITFFGLQAWEVSPGLRLASLTWGAALTLFGVLVLTSRRTREIFSPDGPAILDDPGRRGGWAEAAPVAACAVGGLLAVAVGILRGGPSAAMRATPIHCFSAETERLANHLDVRGGCARIEYDGPPSQIRFGYEIWRRGVVDRAFGPAVAWLGSGTRGDVSALLERIDADPIRFEGSLAFRSDERGTPFSAPFALDPLEFPMAGSFFGEFFAPDTLVLEQGEEGVLWCRYFIARFFDPADERLRTTVPATMEEALAEADWAFVFKIGLGSR